ncbi:tripartite tricarboxylate transporter permease [Ammoniphilus sp. CFH 90114]|uniref:tripartite tricarboxylate transporter permease n=1 Tax=Ammoniphilus sp. CFH 90114 TaxID=2493665 RepID=UPI00100DEEF0|nr:tripartite tricarboxylate transporter permease [Ammoniphilus sp. CFH 90114]RXT07144.1 hypothetical protein EIZ39_13430 [Ammoniphilus sp. CFH 90114]
MELIVAAFQHFFTWDNLILIPIGIIIGQVLGAIPGMSSMMAISVAIPFTYSLSPVAAVTLLMSFYKGALAGGSISAILLGTPGTVSAAATVMDGYPLAQQGKAGKALQTAQISSAFGSLFADILLLTLTGFMAQIALLLASPELLLIVMFALMTVGAFTAGNKIRGILSALIGIGLSLIGPDPTTGLPRYSFGIYELEESLPVIPVLLGLLALSEILYSVYKKQMQSKQGHLPPPQTKEDSRMTWQDFKNCFPTIVQSSAIGSFIGMMPGLGPSIGGFLSHREARRTAKQPEKLGKGAVEGVAAAEAGNNSVSGSNLIPMLSFGIPGDAEAALVMGALMLHGIYPGPQLFENNGPMVYGLFFSLIFSDLVLIIIGLWIIRYIAIPLTKIPTRWLYPLILVLMLYGTYGTSQNLFDLWLLVVFGIIGFLLRLFHFSIPALVIGFILGNQLEGWLQRTVIMAGDNPFELLLRPGIIVILGIFLVGYVMMKLVGKKVDQSIAS